MTKKKILFFSLIILIILLGVFWFKVGKGLIPLLPTSRNVAEKIEEAESKKLAEDLVDFPLKIDGNFNIRVFVKDLDSGARVLAFDDKNNLLTSLTKSGRVIILPDDDSDGRADKVITLLDNLNRPHGLAFYKDFIYVAETDKIVRYKYDSENLTAENPEKILDLNSGGNHFTRTIKFGPDNKLYITSGSTCNVCVEKSNQRAVMMRVDPDGKNFEVFATGLRNTVFFVFDDEGNIWGNDMGRDLLGDLLPPDELNIIKKDSDYGWPFCYGKNLVDPFGKSKERCKNTIQTTWDYHAHVAPLGLTFINSPQFPKDWQGDILTSFHGSWNSSVPVGYKIARLGIKDGKVTNEVDFITGFLEGSIASGRPADLIFGSDGSLYISDDKANAIYILKSK